MSKNAPRKKRSNPARDKVPVIYCLQGVWRYEDDPDDQRSHDASIKPLLEYLKEAEYWDYRHRDVATIEELQYYLDYEWQLCTENSILYLSTHGSPGSISLSGNNHVYMTSAQASTARRRKDLSSLDKVMILENTDFSNCHVHFCGCAVMSNANEWADEFLESTNATVVSGYISKETGWTDLKLPAILADVMLFSALADVNYRDGRSYTTKLRNIQKHMNKRFADCKFYYRTDKGDESKY